MNKLSQFIHSPSQTHWAVIKRLFRYLKHTLHHGLLLHRQSPLIIHGFSDFDWAINLDDHTSTTTFVLYLGKNPISWCSKKQRTVPRSFTEAEYRAVASITTEVNWVQSLLRELHVTLPSPPTRYCDNVGATYVCANLVFHSQMKHIAIDYHFVRDQVFKGLLRVFNISTKDQLADALTKPLSSQRFDYLRSKIDILDRSSILKGRIKDEFSVLT